jgi:site-specific recombinase XerD
VGRNSAVAQFSASPDLHSEFLSAVIGAMDSSADLSTQILNNSEISQVQKTEQVLAGEIWQDSGLVFTTQFGTPVEPRNVLRTVQIAAARAGLKDIGTHTLRHSAAVAWLEKGVHIRAVADLLGHSSISVTGDVYGHTSDDTARTAVDDLADQLGF